VLTVRLMEMERMPDASRDAGWWRDYVRTCDALARLIQVTRGATWGDAQAEAPRRRVGARS
jgi:hypothetical protein